jgi:hypothetical protein
MTMNVFKGLLYLIQTDPPASPVLIQSPRYGAATAAKALDGQLGNRAASRRRFGERKVVQIASADACLAAGGCR